MKKVMIISPDFGFGGAERSAAAISNLLATKNEIHFVVFNTDIKQAYAVGGTLHSLGVKGGKTWLTKIVLFAKRVIALRKLKSKLKVDVALSLLEGADYINVLSKGKERVILSLRGSKKNDPNIKGFLGVIRHRFLIPRLYAQADCLTAVSHGIKTELINHYGIPESKPFFVVPNFYDLKKLKEKASEPLPSNWDAFLKKHLVITAVGRIAHEKGFDLLLDVFAELHRQHAHLKLIFIGDGPDLNKLAEKLQRQDIIYHVGMDAPNFEASVFFVGYQSNPLKFVARSSVFTLSSLTEGFPNALMEAMAVGVPTIAADCPYGPRELLSKQPESTIWPEYAEHGILVPMLNKPLAKPHWIAGMNRLLGDESLRKKYTEAGLARAAQFSEGKMLNIWQQIFDV